MKNDSYPQAGTEILSPSHLGPDRDQDYAELQVSNRQVKDSVLKSRQATTLTQQGQGFHDACCLQMPVLWKLLCESDVKV